MWAARKARKILGNVRSVIAIEFLSAAQALDFQPLAPSKRVGAVRKVIRDNVPHLAKDRFLARDIETAERVMTDGSLLKAAGKLTSF